MRQARKRPHVITGIRVAGLGNNENLQISGKVGILEIESIENEAAPASDLGNRNRDPAAINFPQPCRITPR
jgi:hypothetical protein